MNEVLKTIADRYACRDYKDAMPSKEDLEAIAQAAIEAPSALNKQPWQILVVQDKTLMKDLEDEGLSMLAAMEDKTMYNNIISRGGKLFYNAPCMILIAVNEKDTNGYERIDLGIAAQNAVLAASSLGIASVHCGFAVFPFSGERGPEFLKRFQVPEGYSVGLGILLGYANTTKEPHEPDENKITWIGA